MIWVIEFRSGSYLQLHTQDGGPKETAMQFASEAETDEFVSKHEWVAINGGMPKRLRISRYLDLELSARIILRTLPPGSLSAPPSAVQTLQKVLEDLAQKIWTQGWDCREEQGPLAGAFGHANRYNPYLKKPRPSKCRGCDLTPLRTERGRCENCGDCQGCDDDDCDVCETSTQEPVGDEK